MRKNNKPIERRRPKGCLIFEGSNPQPPFSAQKRAPNGTLLQIRTGGELGIRTPDALLGHTRLAGEHLRPLGQLSVTAVL